MPTAVQPQNVASSRAASAATHRPSHTILCSVHRTCQHSQAVENRATVKTYIIATATALQRPQSAIFWYRLVEQVRILFFLFSEEIKKVKEVFPEEFTLKAPRCSLSLSLNLFLNSHIDCNCKVSQSKKEIRSHAGECFCNQFLHKKQA